MSSRDPERLGWFLLLPATGKVTGDEPGVHAEKQITQAHVDAQVTTVCGSGEWCGGPSKQGFDELTFNDMNC